MTPRSRLVGLAVPIVVLLAALAALSPVLLNDFVEWDDQTNFVDNPAFRGFGRAPLAWMATTFHLGVYQPLAWILASIEYKVGGLDPAVYHAGSWLLHAVMAVLVYAAARHLLAGMTRDPVRIRLAAALAALFWAIHPLRVEAVAWASAQGYPIAGVFMLASITAYLKARDASGALRARWTWASIATAILAYLAKPAAVTLPLVLLALDWYPLRRFAPGTAERPLRVWIEKLPYAIPAALIALLAPLARAGLGTIEEDYHLGARTAQAAYGLSYYLVKSVAPVHLSFYVPLPPDLSPIEPRFLAGGLLVVGLAAVSWRLRHAAPALPAALACYVALLLPMLGLIPQGAQLVADRYAYLAGVPLAIMAAAGVLDVWRRIGARRAAVIGLGSILVVALSVLGVSTWRQAAIWKDSPTLFRNTASVDPLRFWNQIVTSNPRSVVGHVRLGMALADAGTIEDALGHFTIASTLAPDNASARFQAGLTFARLNRLDEAIAAYERGLALRPDDATGHAHFGDLLGRRGDLSGAEREYRRAVELVPHPDLFNSLGVVLAEQGRYAEAADAFRHALRMDPTHADADANFRMALSEAAGTVASAPSDPRSAP
jgi:tetratricopeptide (TPR) repeat protein